MNLNLSYPSCLYALLYKLYKPIHYAWANSKDWKQGKKQSKKREEVGKESINARPKEAFLEYTLDYLGNQK